MITNLFSGVTLSNGYIDIGDGCKWQVKDVGDAFGHSGHQHPLSLYISVGHQHP